MIIKSVILGSETLSHLPPKKHCELVPVEIVNVESIVCFKRVIKKWKPMNCPCRLYWRYIFQVSLV